MAELTIGQLIKVILGVLVVVVVMIGLFVFFKGQVFGIFEGYGGEDMGLIPSEESEDETMYEEDKEGITEEEDVEEGSNDCLEGGVRVYKKKEPQVSECCYGDYCSKKVLFFCTERRCCSVEQGC